MGAVGGCALFPVNNDAPRYVGAETLQRIDNGATTQDWIEAVMGQPSFVARLDDGQTQIWKYPYEYTDRSGERMRLLERDERESATRVVFVQVSGGVVTDWWRD